MLFFGEVQKRHDGRIAAIPFLSSSRGVLKWCSLLKKRLAIIPTSARGPVEIGKTPRFVGWDFVEMSRKKKKLQVNKKFLLPSSSCSLGG
jgi:hypothetical protein